MKLLRFAPVNLGALVMAALMAGCSSVNLDEKKPPVETATPKVIQDKIGGGSSSGTSQSKVTSVDLAKAGAGEQNELPHVIYFDFDSYTVKDDYRPVIEANARALMADRSRKLALEGHTDERGGHEYNLALGQKRAESVAKALELLGANPNQLEAVSFGKERPVDQGHDEAAWAKNRRVELTRR